MRCLKFVHVLERLGCSFVHELHRIGILQLSKFLRDCGSVSFGQLRQFCNNLGGAHTQRITTRNHLHYDYARPRVSEGCWRFFE